MKQKYLAEKFNKYLEEVGIRNQELVPKNRDQLKEIARKLESEEWNEEIESRSTLGINKNWKKKVEEDKIL